MKGAYLNGRLVARIYNKGNLKDAVNLGYEVKEIPKRVNGKLITRCTVNLGGAKKTNAKS